jgi:hypothetical protein
LASVIGSRRTPVIRGRRVAGELADLGLAVRNVARSSRLGLGPDVAAAPNTRTEVSASGSASRRDRGPSACRRAAGATTADRHSRTARLPASKPIAIATIVVHGPSGPLNVTTRARSPGRMRTTGSVVGEISGSPTRPACGRCPRDARPLLLSCRVPLRRPGRRGRRRPRSCWRAAHAVSPKL